MQPREHIRVPRNEATPNPKGRRRMTRLVRCEKCETWTLPAEDERWCREHGVVLITDKLMEDAKADARAIFGGEIDDLLADELKRRMA